jgi:hypothetical protein
MTWWALWIFLCLAHPYHTDWRCRPTTPHTVDYCRPASL